MIVAAYGVFAIVGSEPRPKEQSKYASCVNRGALNLGDIPPTDTKQGHQSAFHPATGGAARPAKGGGVYAAMEAYIAYRNQQEQ